MNATLEPKKIGALSTVSTDVGDVSHVVPTAQFFLAWSLWVLHFIHGNGVPMEIALMQMKGLSMQLKF